jgi:predicted RNA-binding protein with PIN domain
MPYLIDGHNLIPKIPGLTLEDVDDEDQLLELLLKFCQHQGKQVEVFFDNAPLGGVRTRNYGLVAARFVRQGTTADEAIRGRLARLGRSARNWTVVSSDQEIQAEARAVKAHYISSDAFANLMLQTLDEARKDKAGNVDIVMDPKELDDWLRLFNSRDGN